MHQKLLGNPRKTYYKNLNRRTPAMCSICLKPLKEGEPIVIQKVQTFLQGGRFSKSRCEYSLCYFHGRECYQKMVIKAGKDIGSEDK